MNGTIPNNPRAQTLDPTLIRRESDNKLFLYTTGKNGSVWTSDSLYGPWTHEGSANFHEDGGAPQIYQLDDTYYLFLNSHEFNYSTTGVENADIHNYSHNASLLVASSKTLEIDSWEWHGWLGIDWAERYNILDASLLTLDDGARRRNLLSFGSYQQGIFQIPLADPPVKIADGANDNITHLANNQTEAFETGPTEASYMFKWDHWYYLFFSSGRCCTDDDTWTDEGDVYKVMVCRSKHPRGDFVDDNGKSCADESGGKEILGTHDEIWAPGGQGVMVDDEAGGPLIYYHYVPYNTTTNTTAANEYRFGWNKLDFSSGWPVVV
ncbi:glycoside hydrolase family 43 protein [Hypoxylon sp. CI-4A]|nr:glycoside hydrolase family 43 protein [Hypoxylon sp. CI-4A]